MHKAVQDEFKRYMEMGLNSQIRVLITTNSTTFVLTNIFKYVSTWDECFGDIVRGRSVARVFLYMQDGSLANVKSPHLLFKDDRILIEFD